MGPPAKACGPVEKPGRVVGNIRGNGGGGEHKEDPLATCEPGHLDQEGRYSPSRRTSGGSGPTSPLLGKRSTSALLKRPQVLDTTSE